MMFAGTDRLVRRIQPPKSTIWSKCERP